MDHNKLRKILKEMRIPDHLTCLYIMRNWKKHKLESRLLGEISITSDMQMTLMSEREEKLKTLLMKVKEESEKLA